MMQMQLAIRQLRFRFGLTLRRSRMPEGSDFLASESAPGKVEAFLAQALPGAATRQDSAASALSAVDLLMLLSNHSIKAIPFLR